MIFTGLIVSMNKCVDLIICMKELFVSVNIFHTFQHLQPFFQEHLLLDKLYLIVSVCISSFTFNHDTFPLIFSISFFELLRSAVTPGGRMRLRPGSLLLLAVWVGVWSVPIDRNEVEQEAKEEETGVGLTPPSQSCCACSPSSALCCPRRTPDCTTTGTSER